MAGRTYNDLAQYPVVSLYKFLKLTYTFIIYSTIFDIYAFYLEKMERLGYSSVIEYSCTICKTLGSISSIIKETLTYSTPTLPLCFPPPYYFFFYVSAGN